MEDDCKGVVFLLFKKEVKKEKRKHEIRFYNPEDFSGPAMGMHKLGVFSIAAYSCD